MSECFLDKKCKPCEGGVEPMTPGQAKKALAEVAGWSLGADEKSIERKYAFRNFQEVMFFMNAIAFIAEREGHHPDIALGYNYCNVTFTTHAIKGLSENDFICAAKINML